MTDTRKNLLVSLVILGLAVTFLLLCQEIEGKGQTVPVLIGWVAVTLCVLDVIAHIDHPIGHAVATALSGAAHLGAEEERVPLSLETVAVLWMVAATAAIILFGFMVATPAYVFAYMLLHGRKRVLQSGLTALITTLFIWVVFEVLMEYEVYRGILFEDI